MSRGRQVLGGRWWDKEVKDAYRIEGLENITNRLAGVIDQVTGKQAKEVYLKAGLSIRDSARVRAPKRTGKLRESIFAARGDMNKPNAVVGVNYRIAPHAHLVEYGTVRSRPRPFLRPAIAASASQVRQIIESGLRRIVEDATRGRN
jgi:HK97 gp10 family phage protein